METAQARITDPETSHAASRSTCLEAGQKIVFELFKEHGSLTDERMCSILFGRGDKISPSGARSLRNELVHQGLLLDSGKRGVTASGRKTIVWEITPSAG